MVRIRTKLKLAALLAPMLALAGCVAATDGGDGHDPKEGGGERWQPPPEGSEPEPPPSSCEASLTVTSATHVMVRGTAEAHARLKIRGGAELVTTTADAAGRFEARVPLHLNAANTLRVQADIDGSLSLPCVIEVIQDAICPMQPALDPLPDVTARAEIDLRGRTEAHALVRIESEAGLVETMADAAGRFEATVPLVTEAGARVDALLVTSIDIAGNHCGATRVDLRIDLGLELEAPIVDPLESPTAEQTITVTGRAKVGADVEITGGTEPVRVSTDLTGRFEARVHLHANSRNMLRLVAISRLTGEASAAVGVEVTHDDAAPEPPTLDPLPDVTADARIEVRGRAEAHAKVRVEAPTGRFETIADAEGRFSVRVDLQAEAETELRVLTIDLAGNASAGARLTIQHRSDEPTVRLDATATLTAEATVTLTGRASAGAAIRIDGGEAIAGGRADAEGRFAIDVRLKLNARNELIIHDTATEATARVVITHDGHAPEAPRLDATASATASATITLTGTAEANARIRIDGGAAIATGTADGEGRFAVTVTLAAESNNELSVVAIDAMGHASARARVSILHSSELLAAPEPDEPNPAPTANLWLTVRGHVRLSVADTRVRIEGGESVVFADVDASGAFSARVKLRANVRNELRLIAIHGSVESQATIVTVLHDGLAPAAPDLASLELGLGLNLCPLRATISLSAVAAVEARAKVRIVNEATGAMTVVRANAQGSFAAELSTCVGDELSFVAIDAAGNASAVTRVVVG